MQKREQILIPKAGSATVFEIIQNEIPMPGPYEVQIQVHYSALNFADIFIRLGLYPYSKKPPMVPGSEISGVVLHCGEKVKNFKNGDQVFAGLNAGGYSSVINVDENLVKICPEFLNLKEACAIPASFITAYIALVEMGRIQAHDRILIDCASGSLGHFMLKIAEHYQCQCVGLTTSPDKLSYLTQKGFEAYTFDEFDKKSLDKFNLIINSGGSRSIKNQFTRLNHFGKLIVLGANELIPKAQKNYLHLLSTYFKIPKFKIRKLMDHNCGVFGINIMQLLQQDPLKMSRLLDEYQHFKIMPEIDKIFSFKEIAKAHQYLESKKSKGKVLISWQ